MTTATTDKHDAAPQASEPLDFSELEQRLCGALENLASAATTIATSVQRMVDAELADDDVEEAAEARRSFYTYQVRVAADHELAVTSDDRTEVGTCTCEGWTRSRVVYSSEPALDTQHGKHVDRIAIALTEGATVEAAGDEETRRTAVAAPAKAAALAT